VLQVKLAAIAAAAVTGLSAHQAHVLHLQHLAHLSESRQTTSTTVARTSSAIPGFASSYGYAGLEALWTAEGGNPGEQAVAACIAEHESGGNVYATGRAGERGLWQIAPGWGSLSTYSPYGNARAAVIISHNGSNWGPWTTARSCGV